MKRLQPKEIEEKRETYLDDPLYVTLTDAIDEVETRIGGLTPEEVWTEVIRIKDELLKTKRPDKTIQGIRTQLETDYQFFMSDDSNVIEQRVPLAGEWTSVVVLTCLVFYLCTADEVPDLNMKIAVKIRKLIWNHPAYYMLRNKQRPAEKAEEEDGNPVPAEDRLHPLIVDKESPEIQALRMSMTPIAMFFAATLEACNAVTAEYLVKTDGVSKHVQIWMTLLRNESVLRALSVDAFPKTGFKESSQINYKQATGGRYDLKLIMNIIGVMRCEGVIDMSEENISNLLFTKTRVMYLSKDGVSKYGTKSTSLTEELHRIVIAIIRKFKTTIG